MTSARSAAVTAPKAVALAASSMQVAVSGPITRKRDEGPIRAYTRAGTMQA
jgi:hypothetical protein